MLLNLGPSCGCMPKKDVNLAEETLKSAKAPWMRMSTHDPHLETRASDPMWNVSIVHPTRQRGVPTFVKGQLRSITLRAAKHVAGLGIAKFKPKGEMTTWQKLLPEGFSTTRSCGGFDHRLVSRLTEVPLNGASVMPMTLDALNIFLLDGQLPLGLLATSATVLQENRRKYVHRSRKVDKSMDRHRDKQTHAVAQLG